MLLLLLILSLSFGQLGRLEITPAITVYLHDLLVVLLIIFKLPKKNILLSPLFRPLLAFAAAALLSLVPPLFTHPPQQAILGGLYLYRWLAYAGIYFVALGQKPALKPKLLRWLALSGLVIAVTGLVQYIFAPDLRFLYQLGWDEHYYRLIGTFLDPNFTGIILVLTLILLYPSPLILLPFTALLLTYSRSSYLAFLAVLFVYLVNRHKFKLLALLFAAFLSLLLLLPRPGGEGVKLERLYSLTSRLDNMKVGLQIFKNHPLTGIGFNLLRYNQNDPVSHSGAGIDNSFIFILATTGILGLAAYLNLLYRCFKSASLLARLSLMAVIAHSLFNNSLFYPQIILWLWLTLALS